MLLETLLKSHHYKSTEQLPEWLRSSESYPEQIHNLRSILGMTQEQLAKRSRQNARLIRRLESQQEVDTQLSTLKKTAEGLGCELVIRFVPKKNIPDFLKEQAQNKARRMVQLSKGSAALEEQEPNELYILLQVEELTRELLKNPKLIWED